MKTRLLGCAKQRITGFALLALLAICGYAGGKEIEAQTVSVSVSRVPYTLIETGVHSVESAAERLKIERQRELEMLEGVAENAGADDSLRRDALKQISELAGRMEVEALATACLHEMGIRDALSVMNAQSITIVLQENAMKNEEMRIRAIDAVSSVSGYGAADIKIILAKN